uniref:Uncharacterized protein n=1 Tax=Setaria italica TaxID=4555 RepID=K3ZGT9_SETIT
MQLGGSTVSLLGPPANNRPDGEILPLLAAHGSLIKKRPPQVPPC